MSDPLVPDAPLSITPKRILVIDDEADIRESLDALLEQDGYAVDLADSGTEGLRKAEAGNYDLILLDLMMPDRSGMEVLREIRERDASTGEQKEISASHETLTRRAPGKLAHAEANGSVRPTWVNTGCSS